MAFVYCGIVNRRRLDACGTNGPGIPPPVPVLPVLAPVVVLPVPVVVPEPLPAPAFDPIDPVHAARRIPIAAQDHRHLDELAGGGATA
jgi:hypothetical protein